MAGYLNGRLGYSLRTSATRVQDRFRLIAWPVDRLAGRAALPALVKRDGRALALVTGRRRVGKTYLLTHARKEMPFFLFTASRVTPGINRRQFVPEFGLWLDEDLRPNDFPSWRTVFNLVFDQPSDGQRIMILDEFQCLGDGEFGAAGVAFELNAAWERRRSPGEILLLLGRIRPSGTRSPAPTFAFAESSSSRARRCWIASLRRRCGAIGSIDCWTRTRATSPNAWSTKRTTDPRSARRLR